MTSTPRISVVIPTYNRAFCLGLAIDSVLQQSLPAHEIIVVDDGSTDRTDQVMRAYAGRVRWVFQPNAGVSAARNTGLGLAQGDWIAFLDSDDEWHPDRLKIQCADMQAHPQAIAHMLDCTVEEKNGAQRSIFEVRGLVDEFRRQPLRPRPLCDVLESAFFPSAWLIARQAIDAAGGFDVSMRVCEDTDLLSRIALQGPFFVNCFAGTKLQRLGDGGGLSELYVHARLEYLENILKTYRHLAGCHRLNGPERLYVQREYAATHVAIALQHRLNGDSTASIRSLIASVQVHPTLFSALKALTLACVGARGFEAMRTLRHVNGNSYRRA